MSNRSARRALAQTVSAVESHADTLTRVETHIRDVLDPVRVAQSALLTRGFLGRWRWLLFGR